MFFGQDQIVRRGGHPVWGSFGKQSLVYAQKLIGRCAAQPQLCDKVLSVRWQLQEVVSEATLETVTLKAN